MEWWTFARFGMFIHWGLYAVPAGVYNGRRIDGKNEKNLSSFIMQTAKIPINEYELFCNGFKGEQFDSDEWVGLAKQAGMKYLVVTAKHHDGFCLWHTKTTHYNVVDGTPLNCDVLGELHKSCLKCGIQFCVYYSIMDWHHPDARGENFSRYRERYMKVQIRELIESYGPLGVLWFDGEWIDEWTEDQGKDLYEFVRGLQTDIIVNNRVGKGRMGLSGMNKDDFFSADFCTPEQQIPNGSCQNLLWETCMTMNDTWGYKTYDTNWKSSALLIQQLVDAVSKGGNFLLNVGPRSDGRIPQHSIFCLREIGEWMSINGDAIHGASVSALKQPIWGRLTAKSDSVYAHIFDWPEDRILRFRDERINLKSAYLLTSKGHIPLKSVSEGDKFTVFLPDGRMNCIIPVVRMVGGDALF